MNARIVSFDSDEHLALQALLPWYANGTLPRDEAAQVQAHLAQCARCRADLDGQARLRALLPEIAPRAGDAAGDAEQRWAMMRARLDADAAAPELARRARRASNRPMARRPTRWLPWAFGLQTALVLAFAVLAGWGALAPSEPYRALGTTTPAAAATNPNALVVFRPDATEQQMRQALRVGNARLVGGPTVTDAYLLQITSSMGIDSAVARLRAQPGVLRVESLEAVGSR